MGAASSVTADRLIMRVVHDEIERPLDAADVDTPRGESAKQEVRRLRGMIEERTLGEDAAEELKKSFDAFDADGSGEIDSEELGELVRQLGLVRTDEQLQEMVRSVDADGSGEIDFEEFCTMLGVKIKGPESLKDIEIGRDEPYGTVMFSEREERFFYKEGDIDDLIAAASAKAAESTLSPDQKEMFREAFDRFDLDGSGEIDAGELYALTKELGLSRTEAELQRMVDEVDEDGSGEIDFKEFCVMMAEIMMEDTGGDVLAGLNGSKRRAMEERAQRKKDSGALIMWSA